MIRSYCKKIFSQAAQDCVASILSLFDEQPEAILLDCGCGDGGFTQRIVEKLKGCKAVYGIEIDPECCKKAENKGMFIYKDDLNSKLSLGDQSADVIFSNQVIEHLYNTDKFISEIYRVLKPQGYAVISTENLSSWHNIFSLLLGWQPFSLSNISIFLPSVGNPLGIHRKEENSLFSGGVPEFMQHARVFAPRGIKEMFEIHGFKCESFLGAGYYPLPGFLARGMAKIDKNHSAFLVLKFRKRI